VKVIARSSIDGPIFIDGNTGESVPAFYATKQRGVIVDKRLNRNALDRPDWY
jgi:hypothetical protein